MRTLKKEKCPICTNPLIGERRYGCVCIYFVCTECNAIFAYEYISDSERDRLDKLMFENELTQIIDLKIKSNSKRKKEKILYINAKA